MKKIGFIGAYDKTDIILYIAKIISLIGKKVLAVTNLAPVELRGELSQGMLLTTEEKKRLNINYI